MADAMLSTPATEGSRTEHQAPYEADICNRRCEQVRSIRFMTLEYAVVELKRLGFILSGDCIVNRTDRTQAIIWKWGSAVSSVAIAKLWKRK